jgi:hypothetical protein
MPSRSLQPVLIAHFDGTTFSGRIFGISDPAAMWRLTLVDDLGATDLEQLAPVNSMGEFKLALKSKASDVWQGRSSVRLIMRSGAREVSGWVMLAPYLAAIREHGPVAEAVIRIVSGPEDQADVATILGFFTENPETLLSISSRRGNYRSNGEKDSTDGSLNPDDLVPVSRADAKRTGSDSNARSAFEQLLDRFREYLEANPTPETQVSEEEDEEEEGSNAKNKKRRSRVRSKGIPHREFFRLIEAIVGRTEKRSDADIERRSDLVMLLRLGLFFSARSADSVSLRTQFLDQWVGLVMRLTRAPDQLDDLEQILSIVLLAAVVSKQSKPEAVLALLQRRLRAAVAPAWADALRSSLSLRRTEPVIPGVAIDEWLDAFDRVMSSRTAWMDAVEVWDAIKGRKEITITNSLLREPEASRLRAIAAGEGDFDDVIGLELTAGYPYCPIHNITLPTSEASRIRTQHIATAASCCNRILLDLAP